MRERNTEQMRNPSQGGQLFSWIPTSLSLSATAASLFLNSLSRSDIPSSPPYPAAWPPLLGADPAPGPEPRPRSVSCESREKAESFGWEKGFEVEPEGLSKGLESRGWGSNGFWWARGRAGMMC